MDAQFDQKILFDTLRDIDQAEMSGALTLRSADHRLICYFHSGNNIYAIESIADAEAQILTQRQLLQLIGQFKQGTFNFDGASESPGECCWALRAADLILQSARQINDEAWLRANLGDLRWIFGPVFNLEERARNLLLSPAEVAVLGQLDQPGSAEQLIDRTGRPPLEILAALYSLLAAGIIDPPHAPIGTTELDSDFARRALDEMSTSTNQATEPPVARAATANPPPTRSASAKPVIPVAQPIQSAQPAQPAQPVKPAPPPEPIKPETPKPPSSRSKLNTGALERLAGVKIRSMSGSDDQGNSESDRYFQQGCTALKNGNLSNAESFLRKAYEMAPENATYLLWLGRLYAKSPKKQKEAEGLLVQACSNALDSVEPRLALAELYQALGLKTKAETALNSALKIDPEHKGAKKKLAELKGSEGGSFWSEDLGSIFSRWKK